MKCLILLLVISGILSHIKIKSPKELREAFNNQPIRGSLSNFGYIPYGYTLVGRLYYDPENTDVDMACKEIKSLWINEEHAVDENPIIMVDRGNCTFVTKVLNVQSINGEVALIVNNDDTDVNDIVMSDDGRGSSVFIPAILINREDGKRCFLHPTPLIPLPNGEGEQFLLGPHSLRSFGPKPQEFSFF